MANEAFAVPGRIHSLWHAEKLFFLVAIIRAGIRLVESHSSISLDQQKHYLSTWPGWLLLFNIWCVHIGAIDMCLFDCFEGECFDEESGEGDSC